MRRVALAVLLLALLPGCREQRGQLKRALSGQPPVVAGSLEGEWQLADLNGGGMPDPAITLRFEGGDQNSGMVSGSSGCNRFSGRWVQDGRTLKLGPFAGTRMACAPAVLAVEQRFLAALGDVTSRVFSENGEVMLATRDGRRLRLRRSTPPSS